MNAHDPDPFRLLWNLGYRRLVPIIPPNAPLAPGSKMAANAARGKDARGKAPGVKTLNSWDGLPGWTTCQPTEITLLEWRAMGAGAGIVTGAHGEWTLLALDADAKSPDHENLIETTIIEIIGAKLPKRVGQAPKAIYVCKVRGNVNGDKIYFGDKEEFEVRSHGQQFVAWGKHRLTGENYRWTAGLPPFDELPEVSAAQIGALMTALQARLPKSTRRSGGDAGEVDQASLRGDPAQVEAAIAALPNSDNRFPGRSDYLDVGYAIKAAFGPRLEGAAFACFWSWCERWDGGDNDRDEAEEDWRRMKSPFRRGAQWLFQVAAEYGTFDPAAPWFEEPPYELPIRSAKTFTGPAPPQRWLVQDLVPARNVTLLYGDGGTGKSLIALQLCAAMATGEEWLGKMTQAGRSLFLTAEDELDEIHRRLEAIARGANRRIEDFAEIYVLSLSGRDAVLAAPDVKTNLMQETGLYKKVASTIAQLKPALLVLDTLADLFGGDEIKRVHARQFVQLLQRLVVDSKFELTVIVPAHPSLSGMTTGTGMSGSTGWSNSVRSRLYLSRQFDGKREIDADVRVLESMKANRSRVGDKIAVRWVSGRFLVENSGAVEIADAMDEAAFLEALEEFERARRFVSDNAASRNYAPRLFGRLGAAIGEARMERAMGRLFARQPAPIRVEAYGPPSKRYSRVALAPADLFSAPSASR